MAWIIEALAGFFSGTASKILSVAFLLLLGLLAWEKRTNADLHEQLGSISSVSAGQVRVISELKADNVLKNRLLTEREAERATIRKQLEDVRLELEKRGRNDPDFAAWRDARLPAGALGLLEDGSNDEGGNNTSASAGNIAGAGTGTGLARRN